MARHTEGVEADQLAVQPAVERLVVAVVARAQPQVAQVEMAARTPAVAVEPQLQQTLPARVVQAS